MTKEETKKLIDTTKALLDNKELLTTSELFLAEELVRLWDGVEWELIDVLYNEDNVESGCKLAEILFSGKEEE
jgi:hypothetical protein